MPANLESIEAKLDELLARARGTPVHIEPPDVPELRASDIDPATLDGVFIQKDGSTWGRAVGHGDGAAGEPVGIIYGYISEKKDPAMFRRMVEVMQDEGRLRELLAANGAFARYKLHPNAVLYQGANSFFLLSMILSSALPEARPS